MLSIVIPTLNEEKYLPRLLDCIESQNLKEKEVIVSDGNSDDATVAIAKKYGCKVVSSGKRSPANQRNEGAKAAQGELLLFLDADTLLPDGFFEPVLAEFQERKLDVADFYLASDSKKLRYRIAFFYGRIVMFLFHTTTPISIGAGILSRRSLHEKIGGFDESLFVVEDHWYAHEIQRAGGRYGMLRSKEIIFSTRRFQKEGLLRVLFKWHYLALRYLLQGPTKRKIVTYDFGKF